VDLHLHRVHFLVYFAIVQGSRNDVFLDVTATFVNMPSDIWIEICVSFKATHWKEVAELERT